MSYREVLDATQALLNNHGLPTYEYGYDIVGAGDPVVIIMRGGSAGGEGVTSPMTYGGASHLRQWGIVLEIFVSLGSASATDTHKLLVEVLDMIVLLLEKYPYLNLGGGAGVDATLTQIGSFSYAILAEGEDSFLSSSVKIIVNEQTTTLELESV